MNTFQGLVYTISLLLHGFDELLYLYVCDTRIALQDRYYTVLWGEPELQKCVHTETT